MVTFYFAGLSPIILYIVIFVTISAISIICLFTVHKLFKNEIRLMSGTRFIVPFFTINGAVLGFILAMILVETWKNYQGEKENITNEASNYIGMYRLANGLAPSDTMQIKSIIRATIQAIVDSAWIQMETGQDGKIVTRLTNKLYNSVLNLKVDNSLQEDIRGKLIDHLDKATELRRHRLLKSHQSVVPEPMWPVIFLCIFISLACGCFFELKPIKLLVILNLFQCAMLSFVLFLIITLMYPYRGAMQIKPDPFKNLLNKTIIEMDKTKW